MTFWTIRINCCATLFISAWSAGAFYDQVCRHLINQQHQPVERGQQTAKGNHSAAAADNDDFQMVNIDAGTIDFFRQRRHMLIILYQLMNDRGTERMPQSASQPLKRISTPISGHRHHYRTALRFTQIIREQNQPKSNWIKEMSIWWKRLLKGMKWWILYFMKTSPSGTGIRWQDEPRHSWNHAQVMPSILR